MTTSTWQPSSAELRTHLDRMSSKELLEYAAEIRLLEKQLKLSGPADDDELHQWIAEVIGIDIPRAAVCVDHEAPFQFISDLYFERANSVILMANRGGSKT